MKPNQSNVILIKRRTVVYLIVLLVALAAVTPALAAYIGPKRTVTETTTVCSVILFECQYVASKGDWRYHKVDSWACSNESKPWNAYPSQPNSQGCFENSAPGNQYWERQDTTQEVTNTYPPATITGSLQNCTLQNGWCASAASAPALVLTGSEPVTGYRILAIEGTLNGTGFACSGSSCSVPLNQGSNTFTYWALSSWDDSSTMGTVTAKVDSQLPSLTGSLTGTLGAKGWYITPVSFAGSASDPTSGIASFTCTLDGSPLPSCGSITVSDEGAHTVALIARDNAGNVRDLTQDISIDTQNPVLIAALNGTAGSNNWYTAATFRASASDPVPGSGSAALEYNLDNGGWMTFPVSGTLDLQDGRHILDVRAADNAGRTVSTSKSFWLDAVDPAITVDEAGTLGSNDWFITNLFVAADAIDATSGIDLFEYSLNNSDWTSYTTPLTLPDGTHTVSFWAQDQAGLATQVDRVYKVDTRPPQLAGSINGTPGANGWYVSDVTLSASAADPLPGSGLDAFTYTVNEGAEIPFTHSVMLKDGQSTVRLNVQDKAGLTYFTIQTIKVDTIPPTLNIGTALPDWTKGVVTISGTAGDGGSGLSKVELSTDGGQTWHPLHGLTTWNYSWDTKNSLDGARNVRVRVTDSAGLASEKVLDVGVDNRAPHISLPESWFQWDTVTLDIWDDHSGLSEARVEISDPQGRWVKRVIRLDPKQFPLGFKWDRRFGDDTVAPPGLYDVNVIAFDNLGNSAQENASIKIMLGVLPAGPTATLQPYSRTESTPTPGYTPTSISSPTATKTASVSVFGSIDPPTQATSTPSAMPAPRAAPTQTSFVDWLESFFVPSTDSSESVVEIGLLEESIEVQASAADRNSSIHWGAAAAAMAGAVTAYALEEKRKQQEEKARQAINEAQEKQRRAKIRTRQMEKLENERAQEKAWEEARKLKDFATAGITAKFDREDAREEAIWVASLAEIRKRYEDKKKAEEEKKKADELQAGLAAYYNATRQGQVPTQAKEKSLWEKALKWVDDHQVETSIGIGAGVGLTVAALVLTTPLLVVSLPVLAAAAGISAVVAGVAIGAGTLALNNHYGRALTTNIWSNIKAGAITAAAVTGVSLFVLGGSLTQAVAATGNALAGWCHAHPTSCARVEPVLNAFDTAEQLWLGTQLGIQTRLGNEAAAAQTALEIQMEHMDGGMPGNSVVKEIGGETLETIAKYGDDALDLVQLYGLDAAKIIFAHGDNGIAILKAVDLSSAKNLLETLDSDVLDYAIQQGPDALAALSRWSAKDLKDHGMELALRAKKDAQVLADVKKLAISGPIDPKHLTEEQQILLKAIAGNSTQYADEGQVVLGKWVDISSGFVKQAKDTGSVHYNPHPDMWNLLGGLGKENQEQVAWLINKQVVETGINKGLPFEYTLNGIPSANLRNEVAAVRALFSGKTDEEIMRILKSDYMPIRMKELLELKKAGYELTFDNVNNSYIFIQP